MARSSVVLVVLGALVAPAGASGGDTPSSEYFVATTGQGLGIAVDLAARDETSDRLRAFLPKAADRHVATVALVNRTSRGARIPVLFAAGESGRVIVMHSPTSLLRGGGLRWWQGQRREPVILAPGRSILIYRVAERLGGSPVVVIRAWVGGRLVATIEPSSR